MRKTLIVDKFEHKGLLCVIVKIDDTKDRKNIPKEVLEATKSFNKYHNGYVEMKSEFDYQDITEYIETVELTYSGGLEILDKSLKGKWFIGFDTAHSWNTPPTQTAKFVKSELRKLCEELLRKKKLRPYLPEIIAKKL